MQQRRSWTTQEDQNLKIIVESLQDWQTTESFDWQIISLQLKERLSIYKTPKQCCDRWNHHLKPCSTKESGWTYDEQIQLFQLQEKMGNKWTLIAAKLPNKSDTGVKNFFYATLRKSIRLINNFISQHRHQQFYKNFKTFPENCIGKIIAQDQNKKTNKMRVTKDNICQSAKDIKSLLLEISRENALRDLLQQAILKISEFNRNCRRLRCKKRKSSWDSEQNCQQKFSNADQSTKNSKDRSFTSKIKDQQLLSIDQRLPKQINKEFGNNPNYVFDFEQNSLYPSTGNYTKSPQNQALKSKSREVGTDRVCIPHLLNRMQAYQKRGSQYIFQGVLQIPTFFLDNSQVSKAQEMAFDNYINSRELDFDVEFHEEYP